MRRILRGAKRRFHSITNTLAALTLTDTDENDSYNKEKRIDTLRWAIADAMKHPQLGFEAVVKAHSKAGANMIRAKVLTWAADDSGRKFKREAGEVLRLLEEIEKE